MYPLEALNAARASRFHHYNRAIPAANLADGERKAPHPAAKLVIHKAVGGAVAMGVGFLDTYSGMPAFGADKDGKGGIGIDTIATGIVNFLELGWVLWKGAPVGHGTYLEPIVSGAGDGLLFGWFAKFGQQTGMAKKGGADAMVAGLDFTEGTPGDDGRSLPSGDRSVPQNIVQQEVVFDPMHGLR